VAMYALLYVAVTALLGFPLSIYEDFVREHTYGLSTMTFGAWMGDQAKSLMVAAVVSALFFPVLYAIFARARRTWWVWASVVSTLFMVIMIAVSPVFLSPIFNHYVPVASEQVRGPILSMARANGIDASEVWEFDASRQSNRVSANVNGMLGTQRISLNDNLLKRCSIPEIMAVMGHEMGHYVLNHIEKMIVHFGLLIVVGMAFVRFGFEALRRRFGARWKVEGIDDPAGLPLVMMLFSAYFLLMTPVFRTLVRTQEAEADIFGLNASRQPDGMAQVALKLGEYRKLDPGPIEELVFFDHPSGRARIHAAMRWKAEHLGDPQPVTGAPVTGDTPAASAVSPPATATP
jgi:STE24 endopeptidase